MGRKKKKTPSTNLKVIPLKKQSEMISLENVSKDTTNIEVKIELNEEKPKKKRSYVHKNVIKVQSEPTDGVTSETNHNIPGDKSPVVSVSESDEKPNKKSYSNNNVKVKSEPTDEVNCETNRSIPCDKSPVASASESVEKHKKKRSYVHKNVIKVQSEPTDGVTNVTNPSISCDKSLVASVNQSVEKPKEKKTSPRKSTTCRVISRQVGSKEYARKKTVKSKNKNACKQGELTKCESDNIEINKKKPDELKSEKDIIIAGRKYTPKTDRSTIQHNDTCQNTNEDGPSKSNPENIDEINQENSKLPPDHIDEENKLNNLGKSVNSTNDNKSGMVSGVTNEAYALHAADNVVCKNAENKSNVNQGAASTRDASRSRTNSVTMFQNQKDLKTNTNDIKETKNIANVSACPSTSLPATSTATNDGKQCTHGTDYSSYTVDVFTKCTAVGQAKMNTDSPTKGKQVDSFMESKHEQELSLYETNSTVKQQAILTLYNEIEELLRETLSKSLKHFDSKLTFDLLQSNLIPMQRHLNELIGKKTCPSFHFHQFQANVNLIQQKLVKTLKGKLAYFINFQQQMKMILSKLITFLHSSHQARFRQCLESFKKTAQQIINMSEPDIPPRSTTADSVGLRPIPVVAKPTIPVRQKSLVSHSMPDRQRPPPSANYQWQFNQAPPIPNLPCPPMYPTLPRPPGTFQLLFPPVGPPVPPPPFGPFLEYRQTPFFGMPPNYPQMPPNMQTTQLTNPNLMSPSMAQAPPLPGPYSIAPPPTMPQASNVDTKARQSRNESYTESNELDYFLGITCRRDYAKSEKKEETSRHRESHSKSRSRSRSRASNYSVDDFRGRKRSLSDVSSSSPDEKRWKGSGSDSLSNKRKHAGRDTYRLTSRSLERSPVNMEHEHVNRNFDTYSGRHRYDYADGHSPRRRSDSYRDDPSQVRSHISNRRSHSLSPVRLSPRHGQRGRRYSPLSKGSRDDDSLRDIEERHTMHDDYSRRSGRHICRHTLSDDEDRGDYSRFSPVSSEDYGNKSKGVHRSERDRNERKHQDGYSPVSVDNDDLCSEKPKEAAWSLFDRLRSRRDSGSSNSPKGPHDSTEQPRPRMYSTSSTGERFRRMSRSPLSVSKRNRSSKSLSRSRYHYRLSSRSRERSRNMSRDRSRERYRTSWGMETSNSTQKKYFEGISKSNRYIDRYENCSSSEEEDIFQTESYCQERLSNRTRRFDTYGHHTSFGTDNTSMSMLERPSNYDMRIEKHPDHDSVSSVSLDGEIQNIESEDRSTDLTKYDLVKHILSGQSVADIYNSCAKKPDVMQGPNMGYAQSHLTGKYNEIPHYTPVDEVNVNMFEKQQMKHGAEAVITPVVASHEHENYIKKDWEFPHKGMLNFGIHDFIRESDAYKNELVAELVNILIDMSFSSVTFRTFLSKIRERIKIQFKSIADLKELLKLYPNNFGINESDSDWNDRTNVQAEKPSCIMTKTTIGFCETHSYLPYRVGKCACNALHICKFYLFNTCPVEQCKFGHVIKTEHNIDVLVQHRLHRITVSQLLQFLTDFDNRNSEFVPEICKFYNRRHCFNDGKDGSYLCHRLHLCREYVLNCCKHRIECKNSHSLLRGQARRLLMKYGMDPAVNEHWKILRCFHRNEVDRMTKSTDKKQLFSHDNENMSMLSFSKTRSGRKPGATETSIDVKSLISRVRGTEHKDTSPCSQHNVSDYVSVPKPGTSAKDVSWDVPRLPEVCKFYNLAEGCKIADWGLDKKCRFLHVCQHFIDDNCKFGMSCKRSHNLLSVQVISVFKSFQINITDLSEDDVLQLIKMCRMDIRRRE